MLNCCLTAVSLARNSVTCRTETVTLRNIHIFTGYQIVVLLFSANFTLKFFHSLLFFTCWTVKKQINANWSVPYIYITCKPQNSVTIRVTWEESGCLMDMVAPLVSVECEDANSRSVLKWSYILQRLLSLLHATSSSVFCIFLYSFLLPVTDCVHQVWGSACFILALEPMVASLSVFFLLLLPVGRW